MDLDALLHHYFGTTDLDLIDEEALSAGRERLTIAFGIERDSGRRFAMWALMHGLGDAPDPAVAFKNADERRAAETYARVAGRVERS